MIFQDHDYMILIDGVYSKSTNDMSFYLTMVLNEYESLLRKIDTK